jgi:hypothetical protein
LFLQEQQLSLIEGRAAKTELVQVVLRLSFHWQ